MVGARSHQVSRVGGEGAVPDPALVSVERRLEREGVGVAVGGAGQVVLHGDVVRLRGVDGPDPGRVVGTARGEVAHVGGEQHAGDVGLVGDEGADGDKRGDFAALDHAPDVDFALGKSVC